MTNYYKVDYIDSDGSMGYSYFADKNMFNGLADVINISALKLHIPVDWIIGIRKVKQLPSNVGKCYFEI